MKFYSYLFAFALLTSLSHHASAQVAAPTKPLNTVVAGIPVNYDEANVPPYTLPDVLTLKNGKKVTDQKTWLTQRRPELVELFSEFQFGRMPAKPSSLTFNEFDKGTPVFGGKAIRKQVTVYFTSDTSDHKMDILIYMPAAVKKPAPLLLMISFTSNASMAPDDPGVKSSFIWTKEGKKIPAPKAARPGLGQLEVEKFAAAGIAVATIHYMDIEPDFKNGYRYGIRGYYLKPGEKTPGMDQWGAISAWSWGLSRAMDYIETNKLIDKNRVALFGVSRLGKTVLWTGARDTRFKVVIASCSGEGGAALSRRNYGENIAHMSDTSRYYYQFAPNWHEYSNDFNRSPVDGHMLVSLMAPRSLLLQTGDSDFWSDPNGEFLSAIAANLVYKLFGKATAFPPTITAPGDPVIAYNPLGYYMHAGGHGTVPSDWDVFLEYLRKFL